MTVPMALWEKHSKRHIARNANQGFHTLHKVEQAAAKLGQQVHSLLFAKLSSAQSPKNAHAVHFTVEGTVAKSSQPSLSLISIQRFHRPIESSIYLYSTLLVPRRNHRVCIAS